VNVALPLHGVVFGELPQLPRLSSVESFQSTRPSLRSHPLEFADSTAYNFVEKNARRQAASNSADVIRKPGP
jgi:hypothetical protein